MSAYYRVVVEPTDGFSLLRTQDVGRGHTLRVAGKRANGSWVTQAWLISKEDAVVVRGKLKPLTNTAKAILARLEPVRIAGDVFRAVGAAPHSFSSFLRKLLPF